MNDSPTDSLDEAQALRLVETAQQMIQIWDRLPVERQAALLQRFGTRENALAALVATRLVSDKPQ
ncbi:hypothetical protein SFA35_20120 [Pseudomonas sp. HR96]|uniref:hypothetical protein n=1 Tax=Pseudomonas sp. HR96 TaxID=1027966 RepID=UPI002A750A29|nr:hypothetical protein [Pseudomonas sp. HR96]WPO98901.1 hypothetical protein SFA35_20120 [Pseudomonas sp. HR96]